MLYGHSSHHIRGAEVYKEKLLLYLRRPADGFSPLPAPPPSLSRVPLPSSPIPSPAHPRSLVHTLPPPLFLCRLVDELGVDMLYGHSSHHIRGAEVYKGKLVLYGAGDIVNDYEVRIKAAPVSFWSRVYVGDFYLPPSPPPPAHTHTRARARMRSCTVATSHTPARAVSSRTRAHQGLNECTANHFLAWHRCNQECFG